MKSIINFTILTVILLVFALPLSAGEEHSARSLDHCGVINNTSKDHCGSCSEEKAELRTNKKECKQLQQSASESNCSGEKVRKHKSEKQNGSNCNNEAVRKQEHKCKGKC